LFTIKHILHQLRMYIREYMGSHFFCFISRANLQISWMTMKQL